MTNDNQVGPGRVQVFEPMKSITFGHLKRGPTVAPTGLSRFMGESPSPFKSGLGKQSFGHRTGFPPAITFRIAYLLFASATYSF
jgi:hypothetical protein